MDKLRADVAARFYLNVCIRTWVEDALSQPALGELTWTEQTRCGAKAERLKFLYCRSLRSLPRPDRIWDGSDQARDAEADAVKQDLTVERFAVCEALQAECEWAARRQGRCGVAARMTNDESRKEIASQWSWTGRGLVVVWCWRAKV